jgi:hypothetical protein
LTKDTRSNVTGIAAWPVSLHKGGNSLTVEKVVRGLMPGTAFFGGDFAFFEDLR